MGSLHLNCPLCCNETFSCHKSLRYHLLSIVENLMCPACNCRHDNILALAEHLDGQCTENTSVSSRNDDEDDDEDQNNEADSFGSDDLNRVKSAPIRSVKVERTDEDSAMNPFLPNDEENISNSILAKALLDPIRKNNTSPRKSSVATTSSSVLKGATKQGNLATASTSKASTSSAAAAAVSLNQQDKTATVGEVEEEEEEYYYCSGCAINFSSVEEHIKYFHQGQEVLVQDSDDKDVQQHPPTEVIELSTDDIISDLPDGATVLMEGDAENPLLLSELTQPITNSEMDDSMHCENDPADEGFTLKEENCVDRDGRKFTRKVVQIGKFWVKTEDQLSEAGLKGISTGSNVNKTTTTSTAASETTSPTHDSMRIPVVQRYIQNEDGNFSKASEEDLGNEDPRRVIDMFQCSTCLIQFSRLKQYETHECNPETGSYYKCTHCESIFNNNRTLRNHLWMIHGNAAAAQSAAASRVEAAKAGGPFLCLVCDTEFPTNKSLRLHRRMHDPVKTKSIDGPVQYNELGVEKSARVMFTCKVCNMSFDKDYEEVHMEKHSVEKQYNCEICNRKFFTSDNLEMHMRVHGGEKSFSCSNCKKGFSNKEGLVQHMQEHCASRPYQCQYCGRRFARPHEKVKHERIHTGEKPHECEICGKSFRVSYCLTLHMRTHSGFRPYACQHCGKRFKAHSVYNHHLLTHSEVRNYKCPFCPKAFKTGVQLAGHKNSHTKPFSCTECNRPFASLYAVRAHMETHKRENNLKFNCYMCGASYARSFALRDHIKEQHADDLETMENEESQFEMIEEGMDAAHSILPDHSDNNVLLVEMVDTPMDIQTTNEEEGAV